MKNVSSEKKNSPEIPEKFFPRGTFPEKVPRGIFWGTPGKISGNPGNSRKFPENFGGFSGFPGWKRVLPL